MPNDWRTALATQIPALPETAQAAALGLLAHADKKSACRTGAQALTACGIDERHALWALFFPALKQEVELAWTELPAIVMTRRDGGSDGFGERFTWPPDEDKAAGHRFTWLRKLLMLAGPCPEAGLPELLARANELLARFGKGSAMSYDRVSGHCYDADAPAYLAAAVLNRGGPTADACLALLRAAVEGTHPSARLDRLAMTALLCCERREAWELVDGNLANAGIDEGFRVHLLAGRAGTHPGAWGHFLATVFRERLWRYPSGRQFLDRALGMAWQWESAPGIASWLETWVRMHAEPAAREAAFRGGAAPDLFLALFALAVEDGPAALARAGALVADANAERRLACAFFLALCPGPLRGPQLAKMVDDPDPRVGTLAAGSLNANDAPRVREPGFFARLETVLSRWPDTIPKPPPPWPTVSGSRDDATVLLVAALPEGEEQRIVPWLGRLSTQARQRLIRPLNRMEQTPSQRAMLFRLIHDPAFEISEHAVKAVRGQPLTDLELGEVEALLAQKNAQRRLLLLDLLLRQTPATALASAHRLLGSRKIDQRLAGLELLRRMAAQDPPSSSVGEIVRQLPLVENPSADEQRQLAEIRALVSPATTAAPPTPANAFGLVDPATLPKYPPAQDRGVMLNSPTSVVLLREMDELLARHANEEFTTCDWLGEAKRTSIALDGVPFVRGDLTAEDNRKRFPLLHYWQEWWRNRPAGRRDADGFELERLSVLLGVSSGMSQYSRWFEMLYGVDSVPAFTHRPHHLENVVAWLKLDFRQSGWRAYVLDACETAVARMSGEPHQWLLNHWLSYARERVIARHTPAEKAEPREREEMEHYWRVKQSAPALAHHILWEVLKARALDVATDDELTWHLLGERTQSADSGEPHFDDFGTVTSPHFSRMDPTLRSPAITKIVERCRERVLEVELRRGEAPAPSAKAARRIGSILGAGHLAKIAAVLGRESLRRATRREECSRAAVFSHLISVCHPAPADTPEALAAAVRDAGIPRERLIEIAVVAPQWAALLAHALGEPGLPDCVDWIHAHTKATEWVWQAKTRELWAGELSRLTPLSSEELLEGAVDVAWFERSYAAAGPELWKQLYAAAKYASTGAGHARARLFADALLGEITAQELTELIRGKRQQDAVRALGLVPLPAAEAPRRAELLRRYRVLAEFRHGSAQAKALRRASEELAARIGLGNLARTAGHSDPERFAWAMETEAAGDFAAGPLRAQVGDLSVTLEVTPAGKLELSATRAGKTLKSLPAAAKKHPAVAALLERREEARDQVARMRPALEDMMARGRTLEAGEWRGLLRHPFVAPLLRRLVLTAASGPLGFPSEDGAALIDAAGTAQPWPEDATPLRLAHPGDLLSAGSWHAWQRACFDRQITQPFKQVFRELYVVVGNERDPHGGSLRYAGHAVQPRQALALLTKRGWVHHPEEGLHRVFHDDGCVAWLDFRETFYGVGELSSLTVAGVRFATKARQQMALDQVPARVFSEAMRDVDLVVSVAHTGGGDPSASRSSVEIRADLIRETCRMMKLENVTLEPPLARIAGQRGAYGVHLGSGVVHLAPGRMLFLQNVGDGSRLFLPFADDDPQSVEVLSKVLLLAEDHAIRDPGFLQQVSK